MTKKVHTLVVTSDIGGEGRGNLGADVGPGSEEDKPKLCRVIRDYIPYADPDEGRLVALVDTISPDKP